MRRFILTLACVGAAFVGLVLVLAALVATGLINHMPVGVPMELAISVSWSILGVAGCYLAMILVITSVAGRRAHA